MIGCNRGDIAIILSGIQFINGTTHSTGLSGALKTQGSSSLS